MVGIEGKVALEAVKPASGLVAALLEQKVQKVRAWSEARELKNKMKEDKLANLIENYLTKLAHKVSEITSIAFPQMKLPINETYEPLSLHMAFKGQFGQTGASIKRDIPFKSIINAQSNILLIDSAGMGKSTFSKYVVAKIILGSERIPIFFELRKVNIDEDLIENLARQLDGIGEVFDRKLFYKLLNSGKFYVIADGFDEVPLEHQEKLSSQLNSLSVDGGDNLILLTSRPQNNLPDIINCKNLEFNSFSKKQAISLIKRYDSFGNWDVGERLIEQLDNVPEKLLETPLLVSLLYRTYGVNNSIADRICTFYDEIYHALYKGHDIMNKNNYTRKKKSGLDFEDFRRLLRSTCFYMSISRMTSFESYTKAIEQIRKASNRSNIKPASADSFLDDLLVSVPLMTKEGLEIKFLHKTILEYFAAEYLIYHNDSKKKALQIFNSRYFQSFEKVFDFVYDISPDLFEATVAYFWASKIVRLDPKMDNKELAFHSLNLTHDFAFGLWEVSTYSDTPGERFDHSKTQVPFNFIRLGYSQLEIEGVNYFCVFAVSESDVKYHHWAFKELLHAQPDEGVFQSRADTYIEEEFKKFPKNSWVIFNDKNVELLKENTWSCFSVMDFLSSLHGLGMNSVNLSIQKARNLVDRIDEESKYDEEIEDYLS